MVERHIWLSLFCHVVLLIGAAAVCLPLYFAFVAGSLTVGEVQQVPFPLVPGDHFVENTVTAWMEGDFGRLYLNSIIVTVGIVVGKLAVSVIAGFAVTISAFPSV